MRKNKRPVVSARSGLLLHKVLAMEHEDDAEAFLFWNGFSL